MIRKVVIIILILVANLFSMRLVEAVETASPSNGYYKYVILEEGVVYSGGLLIGKTYDNRTGKLIGPEGYDIKIEGNGAILDLNGEELAISFCNNRLDIENCVIINGVVKFRGDHFEQIPFKPYGTIKHITFYKPEDYGVKLKGAGLNIEISKSIVVDPIDTGEGFQIYNSVIAENIPTGTSFGMSANHGLYGFPNIMDNWSYLSDPRLNEQPIHHFSML